MVKVKNKKANVIENEEPVVAKKNTKFNISVILCALFIVGLLSAKLYSDVQLNELTDKASKMKKELETLKSEEIRINVLLEKRTDLREIERKATEELGLKKIEKYQVEYISLPSKDKTEVIAEEENGIINSVVKGFSIILEFLS
jgi:hypothetical protein